MKLGTRDDHHVSGHCWKGFQGHVSKVKITAGSRKFCTWHDISLRSGGISVKLAINYRHVSGNCW